MSKYYRIAYFCWSFGITFLILCLEASKDVFNPNNVEDDRRPCLGNASEGSQYFHDDPGRPLSGVEEEYIYQPIESDPIIEDISADIQNVSKLQIKRNVVDRVFSDKEKIQILEQHNMYRGNVTPPAGNMAFMEWDKKLEELAQLWADGCVFAHGKPPNTSYPGPYGQNLYIGTDPTGNKALWMWYEEYHHYDLRTQKCKPDEQCGHYVQLAWAESSRLGCAVKKCGLRYLIVCHYYPPALKDQQMYDVSRPCAQCMHEKGSVCVNNLCMNREQCERNSELCETGKCNLKCQNCGRLNKTSCQCECADGWDSPDCSRPCLDEHKKCGISPGFPSKASCSINRHMVAKKFCRKMCESCNPYEKGITLSHTCCGGIICAKGYVLDLERKPCRCTLDCPGPQCDLMYGYGVSLQINLLHTAIPLLSLYFIVDFLLFL